MDQTVETHRRRLGQTKKNCLTCNFQSPNYLKKLTQRRVSNCCHPGWVCKNSRTTKGVRLNSECFRLLCLQFWFLNVVIKTWGQIYESFRDKTVIISWFWHQILLHKPFTHPENLSYDNHISKKFLVHTQPSLNGLSFSTASQETRHFLLYFWTRCK